MIVFSVLQWDSECVISTWAGVSILGWQRSVLPSYISWLCNISRLPEKASPSVIALLSSAPMIETWVAPCSSRVQSSVGIILLAVSSKVTIISGGIWYRVLTLWMRALNWSPSSTKFSGTFFAALVPFRFTKFMRLISERAQSFVSSCFGVLALTWRSRGVFFLSIPVATAMAIPLFTFPPWDLSFLRYLCTSASYSPIFFGRPTFSLARKPLSWRLRSLYFFLLLLVFSFEHSYCTVNTCWINFLCCF